MLELFDGPKLIGSVADINSGKSNMLYDIIEKLGKKADFNLYTYGLKFPIGEQIFSLEELEQIQNSIIIVDEAFSLLDLENRGKKKQIESTLRLLHHNNNIILFSILPENGKKFIASKFDAFIFKKCTIADFINGSMLKRIVDQYRGPEKGNCVLNIPIDKALTFDGKKYKMHDIDYHPDFDSKAQNQPILKTKKVFKKK